MPPSDRIVLSRERLDEIITAASIARVDVDALWQRLTDEYCENLNRYGTADIGTAVTHSGMPDDHFIMEAAAERSKQ